MSTFWEQMPADTFTDGDGRMFVIDDRSVVIFERASSTTTATAAMYVPLASFLHAADEARARVERSAA